ncbi:cupin domain-containing protein [Vagococcus carniphilus]|uniref:Cupin domain-containing protein n=1 Tax=Vagococcus carniphilus TaxID=218144 RepID=A0AAW8U6H0_9ENTE|nr:cupin domain-containing protein [Vagococcus carniphilus]MDT2814485.1 cupin domain-containing protein [Vagococcus carniphilus]MDT2830552.1 cupin domain-containing protein [Vagococcus carniphilus]MDT2832598.1 cupin domain-containing protein [Vagococcus carniphilus]MDT2839850.1 cupin domain-containing protein [Vagococcus carniphilus]MDT2849761.1 cupin domain-containing protein [Vagococcus carniphilus]
MDENQKNIIEDVVRQVLMEKMSSLSQFTKNVDPSGVLSVKLPLLEVDENDRLDTGTPTDVVYCKDLVTLEESPRLGCGLMVMKDTTFDWTLEYDEVDYIIEGTLTVIVDGRKISAGPGEILFIPKSSSIQFSVEGDARFVYVTYPADWASQ